MRISDWSSDVCSSDLAAEEDHQVRMFGAADPDFLAVDDIIVADLTRKGADARRVGARGRFGDAEGLKAEFSARDRGQIGLLLRLRPVLEQGAHRIHLCMARTAVAARTVNFLEHRGRSAETEARPAILFGDDRKSTRLHYSHDSAP